MEGDFRLEWADTTGPFKYEHSTPSGREGRLEVLCAFQKAPGQVGEEGRKKESQCFLGGGQVFLCCIIC